MIPLVNLKKKHEKAKAIRKFKQEIKNENNDEEADDRIQKIIETETKKEQYDKDFLGEDSEKKHEEHQSKEDKPIENKKKLKGGKGNKPLNAKKDKIKNEEEREKKLAKRKKMFKNLKKTNKFGQPLMKYQIQNIFQKIKSKMSKGVI